MGQQVIPSRDHQQLGAPSRCVDLCVSSRVCFASKLWVTMGGRWIVLPQKGNELKAKTNERERERLQNTAQLARNPALRKRLPQQGEKEVYQNQNVKQNWWPLSALYVIVERWRCGAAAAVGEERGQGLVRCALPWRGSGMACTRESFWLHRWRWSIYVFGFRFYVI